MKYLLLITSLFIAQLSFAKTTEEIKKDIVTLAKANTSNIQNRPEVRHLMDAMVEELTENRPEVTATGWAQYSPGSWRQIWADEADNSPAGAPKQNLEKIFQYVTVEGRAVNFGERVFPDGSAVTFALEAVGTVEGNVQTTEILKAFSSPEALNSGYIIEAMANDILQNNNQSFKETPAGTFPNGPIGASSDLTILFLDDELKIGTAPNVYSGEIEMFVLERQNVVQ